MRSGWRSQGLAEHGHHRFPRLMKCITSLQFKGTLLAVLLSLSVTALVSGYLLRSSGELVRSEHDTHMVQMARMLAKAAAATLASGDRATLQRLAEESANGAPLLYVIFSDADGHQLAFGEHSAVGMLQRLEGVEPRRAPVPGRPIPRAGSQQIPVFLDISYPIVALTSGPRSRFSYGPGVVSGELLGYVRTGMIADGWYRTMSTKLDLVIGVGILACLAAIPLGFVLIRRVVSPLEGLADAMHRFSQGELDVRNPVRRSDEIGELSMAFNRMADQHQQTHERIVRLNTELERRVAQRTQQLRELASREPLTGLFNRRHFNEMLERRFAEAQRYETDLSCLMLDLDGFKSVNDQFGHHVGDEVLQLTANTVISQLRTPDVPARFGGDEFIALLPQTDSDRARVLAARILERFEKEISQRIPRIRVTMSVGIASIPSPDIQDAESLIRTADHALYEAKAAGKNRIVTAVATPRPSPI